MEGPLPTMVPPQLLVYHCQSALVPNEPPLTLKLTWSPLQIVVCEALMLAGATEVSFTVIGNETQIEL